jgi:hypothetical protein
MPVQRTAEPAVSEFSERRARLDSILTGFGFDPALIDQKIREINSTPMGPGFITGGLSTINADSTADEKAFAIAAWFYFSRYAPNTSHGLDGICDSDRHLTGAIEELFRGSYYMGGALGINDKAEAFFRVESEKYGLEKLKEAALFQLWASQQGASQETIDAVGAQLFGAEWEYGRIAGSRFSQQRDGTYYFKTDDAIDIRQTFVSMAAVPAEETVSGITPVRTGEAPHEIPEDQFERFYSMQGTRLFSNNVNSFFSDDSRSYQREHRRDGTSLTEEDLRKATLFYIWATGMDLGSGQPRLSAEDMETMGSTNFGGVWEFGKLTAENLMLATSGRNKGKFIFETADNVVAARDGFASLPVPEVQEVPATVAAAQGAPVAAESSELALIAARVGVSEEFLNRAIELIRQYGTINVSFNRSDTVEEGMDDGMRGNVPWLRYHPPNGQTSFTNEQLLAAVRDAATSEGIRMRSA